MSGCFGNHPIDRWMEERLNRYLDDEDEEEKMFNRRQREEERADWIINNQED